MNWYITKLVYQIICDTGNHSAQFDVQLKLISANDPLHAFRKARSIGEKEQDEFLNIVNKPVSWKFIDVSEIHKLEELSDGMEMYSQINEVDNADIFVHGIKLKATDLLETFAQQTGNTV